jgi:hypothetical protein
MSGGWCSFALIKARASGCDVFPGKHGQAIGTLISCDSPYLSGNISLDCPVTVGALYYLRGRQWFWRNKIDPNFSLVVTSALARLCVAVRGYRFVFHNLHF